ncbi:unnamed protein product [Prorocentrum cordatum]|uniref:Uncharacterized protein n=1 Tax=Prorocentrum cordatum TaxID=2364126 RepID=A0ABN9X4T3_9DINO|nr:unnamed protein product [Polarella glacialis]
MSYSYRDAYVPRGVQLPGSSYRAASGPRNLGGTAHLRGGPVGGGPAPQGRGVSGFEWGAANPAAGLRGGSGPSYHGGAAARSHTVGGGAHQASRYRPGAGAAGLHERPPPPPGATAPPPHPALCGPAAGGEAQLLRQVSPRLDAQAAGGLPQGPCEIVETQEVLSKVMSSQIWVSGGAEQPPPKGPAAAGRGGLGRLLRQGGGAAGAGAAARAGAAAYLPADEPRDAGRPRAAHRGSRGAGAGGPGAAGRRRAGPVPRAPGRGGGAAPRGPAEAAQVSEALADQRSANRRLSSKSEFMMDRLADFEQQFTEIEAEVGRIEGDLEDNSVLPGRARDHLAQLEARLDKLQCHGVDSLDTFELQSGKDQARALRKVLTRRAETMHDRMDALFKQLRDAMAAQQVRSLSDS